MKLRKQKILRYYNWYYILPQVSIFFLIALVLKEFNIPKYALLSASLYLLASGYLKIIIPSSHRKGLFYLRKGEFEGAIHAFEKSYKFFNNYLWIDTYRSFTLFSISKISYREMALMNIIYCYQNLNNEKEARRVQKLLSKEFPDNPYAK